MVQYVAAISSRIGLNSLSISGSSLQLPSKEIVILGTLLVILQIVDGILTGIGISHFGTSAEGNILLRILMESLGCLPALIIIKTIAVGVVGGLCILAGRVSWLPRAMAITIVVYLGAAILPWSYVLLTRLG